VLQAQVASASTTHASSSTELQALKHKIADIEQEKRDLVAIVSRDKEDAAQQEGTSGSLSDTAYTHPDTRLQRRSTHSA
jgi:hypothetical protein